MCYFFKTYDKNDINGISDSEAIYTHVLQIIFTPEFYFVACIRIYIYGIYDIQWSPKVKKQPAFNA